MADTRPDIILLANTKTDLYAALNAQAGFPAVTVGDQIKIQNKGNSEVRLTTKPTIPIATDGSELLTPKVQAVNNAGSSGEWAESLVVDGLVNVGVV